MQAQVVKVSSNPFAHLNRIRNVTAASVPSTSTLTTTAMNGVPSIPALESMPQYASFLQSRQSRDAYVCIGNAFNKEQKVLQSNHTKEQLPIFMRSLKRLLRSLCVIKMMEEGFLHSLSQEDRQAFLLQFQRCQITNTNEDQMDAELQQLLLACQNTTSTSCLDVASYIQFKILDPCNVSALTIESMVNILTMLLHKGTQGNTRVFTRNSMNYMLRTLIGENITIPGSDVVGNQLLVSYQVSKQFQSSLLLVSSNVLFDTCWLIDLDTGVYMIVLEDACSSSPATILEHYERVSMYL
jgi:hypothetical protein